MHLGFGCKDSGHGAPGSKWLETISSRRWLDTRLDTWGKTLVARDDSGAVKCFVRKIVGGGGSERDRTDDLLSAIRRHSSGLEVVGRASHSWMFSANHFDGLWSPASHPRNLGRRGRASPVRRSRVLLQFAFVEFGRRFLPPDRPPIIAAAGAQVGGNSSRA